MIKYEIDYATNRKVVKQDLQTLSLYDFEGSFDEVIKKLTELKETFVVGKADNKVSYNQYKDGKLEKMVAFDAFSLNLVENYEEGTRFMIVGERSPDASELAVWEEEERRLDMESKEFRRQQFEKLQKEFQ
jgi:hypothetical protein